MTCRGQNDSKQAHEGMIYAVKNSNMTRKKPITH